MLSGLVLSAPAIVIQEGKILVPMGTHLPIQYHCPIICIRLHLCLC